LIGLRTAHFVRSLALDHFERWISHPELKSAKHNHVWRLPNLPSAWPIDRVIISESRIHLSQRSQPLGRELASSLQKNSYQSVAQWLRAHQLESREIAKLKDIWREEDILSMREEVVRIEKLRLNIAVQMFKNVFPNRTLTKIEELVQSNFLKQVPLNYLTGKSFTLNELLDK
jgi:hypothetical protein